MPRLLLCELSPRCGVFPLVSQFCACTCVCVCVCVCLLTEDQRRVIRLFDLFEGLMQNLLIDTPEDPLDWMIQFLKGPEVPRIFVGGPPAVGKRTVCDVAAKSCGATVVDVATVVAAAVTADASLGEVRHSHIILWLESFPLCAVWGKYIDPAPLATQLFLHHSI